MIGKFGLRVGSAARIGFDVEDVARVEHIVAQEFKHRAVNIIGARFSNQVYNRAGVAPVLGLEVRQHRRFGDGFDGQDGCGRAEDAGFVDGRQVAIAVVHVCAVEQVIIRTPAIAVGTEQAERAGRIGCARRVAGRAGDEHQELREVAPVDGQVGNVTA